MPLAGPAAALEKTSSGKTIRLQIGDLTALPTDAIVFYAREDLQLGSGFGAAIRARGGPAVQQELDRLGPIAMGQAVVTGAGTMSARHIVHACGPKFQEPDLAAKLRRCVTSALEAAAGKGMRSLALPPLGAGFYGVPLDLCSRILVDTITEFLRSETPLAEVVICVADAREWRAFQPKLESL